MRKIKLDEVYRHIQDLQESVGYDAIKWAVMWQDHKLYNIDFDVLNTIHAMTEEASEGFKFLAKALKLTVTIVSEKEDEDLDTSEGTEYEEPVITQITHKFKYGFHVYSEEVKGDTITWEKKEYNEFGQLTLEESSSGRSIEYKYDNGRLTNITADIETVGAMNEEVHIEKRDGDFLELAI